jgi:hypothetical protein
MYRCPSLFAVFLSLFRFFYIKVSISKIRNSRTFPRLFAIIDPALGSYFGAIQYSLIIPVFCQNMSAVSFYKYAKSNFEKNFYLRFHILKLKWILLANFFKFVDFNPFLKLKKVCKLIPIQRFTNATKLLTAGLFCALGNQLISIF